jgi:hypothetical protein
MLTALRATPASRAIRALLILSGIGISYGQYEAS